MESECCRTLLASTWRYGILHLVELSARAADNHILGMPDVFSKQKPREQRDSRSACLAIDLLHPEPVFDGYISIPVQKTIGNIQELELLAQRTQQSGRGLGVSLQIQVFDFLAHNPGGHRVDVKALYIASDAICFNHWGAAAHERISNALVREFVALEKNIFDGSLSEF